MSMGVKRITSPSRYRNLRIEVHGHQEELLEAEIAFAAEFGFLFPEFLQTDKPEETKIYVNSVYGIKGSIQAFFRKRNLKVKITNNQGGT